MSIPVSQFITPPPPPPPLSPLGVHMLVLYICAGSMLFDISLSNIFLALSPQARETKAKINKWDLVKLKSFAQ